MQAFARMALSSFDELTSYARFAPFVGLFFIFWVGRLGLSVPKLLFGGGVAETPGCLSANHETGFPPETGVAPDTLRTSEPEVLGLRQGPQFAPNHSRPGRSASGGCRCRSQAGVHEK